MQKPSTVKFSGAIISEADLKEISGSIVPDPIITTWTRLHFTVPVARDAADEVELWLRLNCTGQYSSFKYHDTKNYTEYKMVVRFENPHDAIIFKLQDGHRAWEITKG